jgi:hypothetical protein
MNQQKTNPRFSPVRSVAALVMELSLGSAMLTQAQVQEYDGFNYSGTVLNTQSGGTGWGANIWTNTDGNAVLSNDGVSLAFPPSVSHSAQGSRVAFTGAGLAERRLGASLSLAGKAALSISVPSSNGRDILSSSFGTTPPTRAGASAQPTMVPMR